ncbi:hypothetical protein A7X88_02915 [Stenotrophomonas maltophilia]|uniref:hypothetical protein n=1 Tax=Stenotrophomonas maltophilia TaxID=40324 RepID=UPI000DA7A986|nr:hypothetical protein [Stenotrophomonas maltophilia]PZT22722.1 hypothetical protein A7X88_02915 [Stenotrophomonas maltophilia]
MTRQIIDVDADQPNGKKGDPARIAFNKVNDNFAELYARTSAGEELGYSQITSEWSSSSATPVDVPGLQINIVAGAQPVSFMFGATVRSSVESAFARFHLHVDGAQVGEVTVSGKVGYLTVSRAVRLADLVLGQSYQLTVRAEAISGGEVMIYASATEKAYVQAVTI